MNSDLTEHGFRWGVTQVTRLAELPGERIVIGISTPKASIEVYVTRTGKLRVFTPGSAEWHAGTSNQS
jgi:hypothetical protein